MATLIRFKRKKSGDDNADVKLQRGEPYYNLGSKKLYVGNGNGVDDLPAPIPDTQKHIAEITEITDRNNLTDTPINEGDATVSFTVGEATDNQYTKTVNNVAVTKGIILETMYFGTEDDREQLAGKMGLDEVPPGTVFFQLAE